VTSTRDRNERLSTAWPVWRRARRRHEKETNDSEQNVGNGGGHGGGPGVGKRRKGVIQHGVAVVAAGTSSARERNLRLSTAGRVWRRARCQQEKETTDSERHGGGHGVGKRKKRMIQSGTSGMAAGTLSVRERNGRFGAARWACRGAPRRQGKETSALEQCGGHAGGYGVGKRKKRARQRAARRPRRRQLKGTWDSVSVTAGKTPTSERNRGCSEWRGVWRVAWGRSIDS
jgi:hypothetical protein